MKKIIITSIAVLVSAMIVQAQTSPGTPAMRTMTAEEANRANGTAQPTINGKPYSQYKAEQDALKQKQPVNNTNQQAPAANPFGSGASTNTMASTDPSVKQSQANVKVTEAAKPSAVDGDPTAPSENYKGDATKTIAKKDVKPVEKAAVVDMGFVPQRQFGDGTIIPTPASATVVDPNSFLAKQAAAANGNVAPTNNATPASRTATEIEKAKKNEEAKVQPAKTDEAKNVAAPQPIDLKAVVGTGTETKPLPSNKQQN